MPSTATRTRVSTSSLISKGRQQAPTLDVGTFGERSSQVTPDAMNRGVLLTSPACLIGLQLGE
jgi:hypothetical protein